MAPLQPKAGHFGLILPLATSSATLGLALFQYPLFYSFLQKDEDSKVSIASTSSIAGQPLSRFWETFVYPGSALIASVSVLSAVSGGLSSRWLHTHTTLETTHVSRWYVYGSVLAAAHLAFVPLVVGPIQRIVAAKDKTSEQADQSNREEMKTWFLAHTARTVLVDFPALVCFAEGVALSFWVTH